MKKMIEAAIVTAAILCTCASVSAQNAYSGYFLDGYTYRYQMNPAFANEKNFISLPVLGNFDLSLSSDIKVSSILYNVDGQTVFFANPKVSSEEAMKGFDKVNDLKADLKLGILSAGFKGFGGYNTISVNAVVGAHTGLPGSLFSLVKEGVGNKEYDLSGLYLDGSGYAEIALGHSHEIKAVPGLRIGATLKFLVGLAFAETDIQKANLVLGEDNWTAATQGDVYLNILGTKFSTKTNDQGREYVSGVDFDASEIAPAGFGFGVDLGAVYEFRDFVFSAAVNNLGAINYKNVQSASTGGTRTFDLDRFVFSVDDDAENSFDNVSDEIVDALKDLYELQDKGNIGSRSRSLATTLNLGVQYKFPVYRKLSFGLLSSTVFDTGNTFSSVRLSANLAPAKCFSAGVNVGMGSFGAEYGAMLSLHSTGFNFFLGVDRVPMFPNLPNLHLNTGINFLF